MKKMEYDKSGTLSCCAWLSPWLRGNPLNTVATLLAPDDSFNQAKGLGSPSVTDPRHTHGSLLVSPPSACRYSTAPLYSHYVR